MNLKCLSSGRFVQLVIASLLFISLAGSVLPTAAEKSGEKTQCPAGQVFIDGKCVGRIESPPIDLEGLNDDTVDIDVDPGDIFPSPEATRTPIVIDIEPTEDVPSPTIEIPVDIDVSPESEATGYVTVHKYDCGPDQTAYQMSLDELRASCSPLANVPFSATNDDGSGQQAIASQAATDTDGLAFLQIANPGVVTVSEVLAQEFGQPIATCGLVIGSDPALGSLEVLANAAVTIPFDGDQQYYCDWFNVGQSETNDTGEVDVQKYVCPVGIDPYQSDFAALQADCTAPLPGIVFHLQEGNQVAQQGQTGADGMVALADVPAGSYDLVENKPGEFGPSRAFCQTIANDQPVLDWAEYPLSEGIGAAVDIAAGQTLSCIWFNIPEEESGRIEILKYACDVDPGQAVFENGQLPPDCETLNQIEFTLASDAGSSSMHTGEWEPGLVRWSQLPPSTYHLTETVPEGYGTPAVYCGYWYSDLPATRFDPEVTDASITVELEADMTVRCIWINLPHEDGSITIYKHVCPPGYDVLANGADAWVECTETGNGIGFWLDGSDYQQTGEQLDSAVIWSNLGPGEYQVSEDVPSSTKTVFVLKCEGNSAPLIQNYPVSIGADFQLYVESGDQIVCHWYNVPKATYSTITVVKYACSTKTFVSQDYCQRYEGGAGFDLSKRDNGNNWAFVDSGYTNAYGDLVFGGLQNGTYQIDEIDAHWCYATADRTDAEGYLVVDNADVTVWVYNCGVTQPKPKPVDFPNTGVGPSAALPLSSMAPVVPAETAAILDWRQWTGALDSRLTAPFASSGKPARMEIESIEVSASIESLEIVDGAFQEPSTADQVAWYRDTAWLGTPGNIVLAGHLNYWGVPEGVFFELDRVAVGDRIQITAENGSIYEYEVVTVQLLPTNPAELQAITAETGSETLTLITCGGDWDPASQSYLHRTVVRAERVS